MMSKELKIWDYIVSEWRTYCKPIVDIATNSKWEKLYSTNWYSYQNMRSIDMDQKWTASKEAWDKYLKEKKQKEAKIKREYDKDMERLMSIADEEREIKKKHWI